MIPDRSRWRPCTRLGGPWWHYVCTQNAPRSGLHRYRDGYGRVFWLTVCELAPRSRRCDARLEPFWPGRIETLFDSTRPCT